MSSVVDVSDVAKSDMVMPAMETLTKDPAPISNVFGVNFSRYNVLVASTFLSVPVGDLNAGQDNSVWKIFSLALETYFQSSKNNNLFTQAAADGN
jgi:U3 small nucleolar RNA-associated protein 10